MGCFVVVCGLWLSSAVWATMVAIHSAVDLYTEDARCVLPLHSFVRVRFSMVGNSQREPYRTTPPTTPTMLNVNLPCLHAQGAWQRRRAMVWRATGSFRTNSLPAFLIPARCLSSSLSCFCSAAGSVPSARAVGRRAEARYGGGSVAGDTSPEQGGSGFVATVCHVMQCCPPSCLPACVSSLSCCLCSGWRSHI